MEKEWEFAQEKHYLFVDFAKAYDSIDRQLLENSNCIYTWKFQDSRRTQKNGNGVRNFRVQES